MHRTKRLSFSLLIGLSVFLTALGCLSSWRLYHLRVKEVLEEARISFEKSPKE